MDVDAATAASHPGWPRPIETQLWWNTSIEILQRAEAVCESIIPTPDVLLAKPFEQEAS
jgi:hypothetical protein